MPVPLLQFIEKAKFNSATFLVPLPSKQAKKITLESISLKDIGKRNGNLKKPIWFRDYKFYVPELKKKIELILSSNGLFLVHLLRQAVNPVLRTGPWCQFAWAGVRVCI